MPDQYLYGPQANEVINFDIDPNADNIPGGDDFERSILCSNLNDKQLLMYNQYMQYKKARNTLLSRPKHVLEHRLRCGKLKLDKHLDELYGRPRVRAEKVAMSMQYNSPSHFRTDMLIRASVDMGCNASTVEP